MSGGLLMQGSLCIHRHSFHEALHAVPTLLDTSNRAP